jgi:4-hydroxybenzoate polyprenyltransferase
VPPGCTTPALPARIVSQVTSSHHMIQDNLRRRGEIGAGCQAGARQRLNLTTSMRSWKATLLGSARSRRYYRQARGLLQLMRVRNHITFIQFVIGYGLGGGRDAGFLAGALTILALCLYGGLYALNGVRDAALDRMHPRKRMRPVASGQINPEQGIWLGVSLIVSAMCAALVFDRRVLALALAFLALNLAYTFRLKHVPYVEIALNSITHPLRFAAGLWLAGNWAHWPLLATWLLGCFAVTAFKRVKEMREASWRARPVLQHYSQARLMQLVSVSLGLLLAVSLFQHGWDFILSGVWFVSALLATAGYLRVPPVRRLVEQWYL